MDSGKKTKKVKKTRPQKAMEQEKRADRPKQSLFRSVIGMMINPAGTVKAAVASTRWYFSVAVSAASFGLFFAQTGLDLYKTGQKGIGYVWLSSASGAAYGAVAIPAIAAIAYAIIKMARTDKDVKWAVSSLCLSYSGALVYGLLGLAISLGLGWRTSVAFGVTGVLWAIGPMIATVREMTDGNTKVSVLVATIYSVLVLVSWSLFGKL